MTRGTAMQDLSDARRAFLASMPHLVLATIRRDGSPQASPVWFLWDEPKLLVSTVQGAAKTANLRRDPRTVACIDDPATGRYASLAGTCRIIEDHRVEPLTLALIRKYRAEPEAQEHWERIREPGDRIVLEVTGPRWIWRRL